MAKRAQMIIHCESQSVCVRLFITAPQTLLISTCLSSREIQSRTERFFILQLKFNLSRFWCIWLCQRSFSSNQYTHSNSFPFHSLPVSRFSPLYVFWFCSDHKMHNDKVCINFLKFCVPIFFFSNFKFVLLCTKNKQNQTY